VCVCSFLARCVSRTRTQEIFQVSFDVQESAKQLTRECTARPCFTAQAKVTVPSSSSGGDAAAAGEEAGVDSAGGSGGGGGGSGGYVYTASINEDRWLRVAHHPSNPNPAPCL
jgi:hypothetical protein